MKKWSETSNQEKVEDYRITCDENVKLGYWTKERAEAELNRVKLSIYSQANENN